MLINFPDIVFINHYMFYKEQIKIMVDSLLATKNNKDYISAIKLVRACAISDNNDAHVASLSQAKDYIDQYIETGIFY